MVGAIAVGIARSVYLSAHVLSVDPFCLKTAQKAITTAKMASIAAIGRFSSFGDLYNNLP